MMHNYANTCDMTLDDFVKHECRVWGEDYVYDLMDRGYTVHLTDRGWRWFAPVRANYTDHVSHNSHAAASRV